MHLMAVTVGTKPHGIPLTQFFGGIFVDFNEFQRLWLILFFIEPFQQGKEPASSLCTALCSAPHTLI